MKIIGFSFDKLSIEKRSNDFKELKIDRNVSILNVEKIKSESIQIKDEILSIKFSYSIEYKPKIADISFSGNVLITADQKIIKDFLREWKNKKFPEEYKLSIFNLILRKSDIKALELEDDLGLPVHVNLPLVREQKS